MERFKYLIVTHFEKILVGVILLAAFLGTYFIEEESDYSQLLLSPRHCSRLFSRTPIRGFDCCLLGSGGGDLRVALPTTFPQ